MKSFSACLLSAVIACLLMPGCEESGKTGAVHKLFIVADDGGMKNTLLSLIGDAGDIRLTIYELNDPDIVSALVKARERDAGVHVVFNYWSWNPLDGGTDQNNHAAPDSGTVMTKNAFDSASPTVPWVNAIPYYYVTHQKTFVFDGKSAMVMSLNLQPEYFGGTRDFAVYTTDPGEVSEILTVFNNDYAQQVLPKSDLDAGSLVWSSNTEGNSRAKLTALINSAQKSVYAYSEEIAKPTSTELGDGGILNAFIVQAEKGVDVKVITAMMGEPQDPSSDPNFDTRCYLNYKTKVQAHSGLPSLYCHAKMVLVDYGTSNGAAYVGSVNLSTGSMDANRELGIIVREPAILVALYNLFTITDWPATVADDQKLCSEKCVPCK